MSSAGVGGSSDYYRVPAEYLFLRNDGQSHMIMDEINVAQPTQHNQTLPSLLGWNILRHFRLVADWANRRVALELP